MVVAGGGEIENDVVFVVEGTANLLLDFEDLKKAYIEPAIHYFNGGIPMDTEYSFGDEYGPNQYGLVVYGTVSHTPDPAVQCVRETRDAKQMLEFLEEVRFEGGGCEECSLLAEALSVALQIFDERTILRGQTSKGIVRKSCIVVCNSPPFTLPSRECGYADDYFDKTVEQLAEEMGKKKGINLSIIAPRKIPALQRVFERSLTVEGTAVLSKDYSKDPNHLVCIQGLDLPVTSVNQKSDVKNAQSITDLPKTIAQMADPTNMKSVSSAGSPLTSNVKESPEKAPKKPNSGIRTTIAETKLQQTAPRMFGVAPSPNVSITPDGTVISGVVKVNPPKPTLPSGQGSNLIAAKHHAQQIQKIASIQPLSQFQNPTPSSGAAAPNAGPEVVRNTPTPNWPQVHNQPQQRPVPQPGGGQPVTQDMNPTQGSQRALAWTGHLEWQDTVRDPNGPQQRITRSLACHVSVVPGDSLKASNWPPKLIMQLIPQNLLSTLGPLLQNSRTVAFHFAADDPTSLRALYRVMASSGVKFAGCVHFPPVPQCDVKVLLLIFSPKKRAFVGLIPNEQVSRIQRSMRT